MIISESLRQIYMRTPIGSCEMASLATLAGLAGDQDFAAVRSLAQIVTFELGGDAECPGFQGTCDPVELLRQKDISPFGRIYGLSFMPREFLKNASVCEALAFEVNPVATEQPQLAALQRLVMRESPMQHEVMKAVVLAAFARLITSPMGQVMSTGGQLSVLDQISGHCRVVPGDNATADFEFGRELILRASTLQGLLSVIFHELGHKVMKSPRPAGDNTSLDQMMPTVLSGLPVMLEAAVRLKSAPPDRDDGRGNRFPSGMSMICSYDVTQIGSAIRLSLMQQAGPIELATAASWAYAILAAMGVDLSVTAAAYSQRGAFHFGFAGRGPSPEDVKKRVGTINLKELAKSLEAKSTDWLAMLRQAGRFGKSERELAVLVGLLPDATRFFGLSAEVAIRDHQLTGGLPGQDPQPAEGDKAGLVRVATRCGDVAALKNALQAGGVASSVKLEELGYSLCVLGRREQKQYLGPSPDGIVSVLEVLHAHGADLNQPLDDDGDTLLTQASIRSVDVIRFLAAHGADVRRARKDGKTPLMIAARFGSLECTQALVEAGSDVQARDEEGSSPLMGATQHGDESIVAYLLKQGANPNTPDHRGTTPLMAAGTASLVKLLHEAGADANAAMPGGMTALMHVAALGRPELVQALLAAGADPEAVTDSGEAALHFCTHWFDEPSRVACAALLVRAGADVNEQTQAGQTALMIAASRGTSGMVTWLVEAGADVRLADRQGNTALISAMKPPNAANRGVIEVLLKAGADPHHANASGETAASLAEALGVKDEVRLLVRERAAEGSGR